MSLDRNTDAHSVPSNSAYSVQSPILQPLLGNDEQNSLDRSHDSAEGLNYMHDQDYSSSPNLSAQRQASIHDATYETDFHPSTIQSINSPTRQTQRSMQTSVGSFSGVSLLERASSFLRGNRYRSSRHEREESRERLLVGQTSPSSYSEAGRGLLHDTRIGSPRMSRRQNNINGSVIRDLDDSSTTQSVVSSTDQRSAIFVSPARQPFVPKRNTLLSSKMKFYSSLRNLHHDSPNLRRDSSFLRPPASVIPPSLFGLPDRNEPGAEQSSWATISTIINTMMGTTVVALPFGFAHAGIALGLLLIGGIGCIACFTCILIVQHGKNFDEFSDFVREFLGKKMQLVAWISSIAVIVGAAIVYHILMQESFFEAVLTIINAAGGNSSPWSRPIAALIPLLVFPLTNLRSISKLVKFNSVGVIFLWYTLVFMFYHGVRAFINGPIKYDITLPADAPNVTESGILDVVIGARSTFGSLSGMMLLSFFIHNCIQPITKNASPDTKQRDIIIAYTVAGVLYALVGILGYVAYADTLSGMSTLSGNFLEMFSTSIENGDDVYALTARLSLLCQLLAVYPVLLFIIRTQFLGFVCDDPFPSVLKVIGVNGTLFSITYTVAALNINVATVTRFSGAICGLVLIFIVPVGADYVIRRKEGRLSTLTLAAHVALLSVGLIIFIMQFIPQLSA